MEANQQLTVVGYLFTESGVSPIVPTLGNYNVLIHSVVAMQAQTISTGGSSLTTPQNLALLDAAQYAQVAATQATKARQLASNKAVVSPDGLTVTIYADDNTTVLHVFDVSSDKNTRTPR